MARFMVQAAVGAALLAVTLQFSGYMRPIPGLQWLFPRLGGTTIRRNINAPKLLSDLNSDILESAPNGGSESHDTRIARAASAALSVMYLASLPGLKEQVKQTPGVLESLVRRIMTVDLQEARRSLLVQHQEQQQQVNRQHQGRHSEQQGHGQVELLSSALLAVAKLVAADRPWQAWLLGEDPIPGATAKTAAGAKRMSRGALLTRLGDILQSGVLAWQAAASMLLATLSGAQGDHPLVGGWVEERAQELVLVGKSLVEAGAHYNSSDALLSGCQLLEVVAAPPRARRVLLLDGESLNLLMQIVLSNAGASSSSSSPMVGSAARLLHRLLVVGGGGGSEAVQLAQNLTTRGLVAPLVREVRLGQTASLAPCLGLLLDLILMGKGAGGGGDGGAGQDVASADGSISDAAREAVGAGVISLCAQLLFKGSPDGQAQASCCRILHHTVAHRRGARGGGDLASGHEAGVATDDDMDGFDENSESGGHAGEALCVRGGVEGQRALARELLRILRETDLPDLHNAVLEACRDVAPSRPAAAALAEAGILMHLAAVLSHNISKSREEGAYDAASAAWMLQSQRSAAALVALLALQPELHGRLVVEGALAGLATAMRVHSVAQQQRGSGGLPAQVRVTAAAALVPLLGEDGRYTRLVVAAGVLEPIVEMHFSGRPQEVQVAGRVMRALAIGDPDVAEMFKSLGIEL